MCVHAHICFDGRNAGSNREAIDDHVYLLKCRLYEIREFFRGHRFSQYTDYLINTKANLVREIIFA
ncbi:hypothetical protein PanWU01x14_202190 [Parasponia andersonii]|uniref:Uncharacterized protein n=1 Tax=Parasponia andersonii TaxID=3476 RepID=A0A2P5BXL4_PARAD|nr:hypothetical protein PanWU01x14_202190 [Parasponia andersonii]